MFCGPRGRPRYSRIQPVAFAVHSALVYEHQDVDRFETSHLQTDRAAKRRFMFQTSRKMRIILIIQVLLVCVCADVARGRQDNVALVGEHRDLVPIYWPIFKAPQPRHVRQDFVAKSPWVCNAGRIKCARVPQIRDCRTSDSVQLSEGSQLAPVPLIHASHHEPRRASRAEGWVDWKYATIYQRQQCHGQLSCKKNSYSWSKILDRVPSY